ncbi:MAG TPA: penicillin-binding protein activator, partial [Nitrosomonas halophila]|nr:penicillin-binding protein activator [Nitrosomonas halophila]
MKRLLGYFWIWMAALYGSPAAFSNPPDPASLTNPANPAGHDSAYQVALLLPLDAPALKQAAQALQMGFSAAAGREPTISAGIRVYPTTGQAQDILDSYQEAVRDGVEMVVGPLTRNGVSALAASQMVTVPTLALNASAIEDIDPPSNLYLFGMNTADEARYVAQLAAASARPHAVIVTDRSELSKRLKAAFADEWIQPDNITSAEEFELGSQDKLAQLHHHISEQDNVVFLALNGFSSRA